MKHALRHACLAALLTVTACADRVAPDEITLPARAQQGEDWSRFLPALYPGLMACLNAHPVQPARADDVVPQNHGMILVRVTGADGASSDCQAGSGGTPAPRLEPAETRPLKGPAFTPATMAEPFAPCFLPEPVLTRDGRLLGWLSYRRPDCERGQTPVLQDNFCRITGVPSVTSHSGPCGSPATASFSTGWATCPGGIRPRRRNQARGAAAGWSIRRVAMPATG